MTNEMMALRGLLEKSADAELLREMDLLRKSGERQLIQEVFHVPRQ